MRDQVQTMAEVTREARVRAGLSMRGLARRSGLSAAQVSRIEAGEVARPVAEAERERRLREELADAEAALAEAERDLDEARERVAAEPPLRAARKRLRDVGILAKRHAVEVAQKRRQFERLDDAPSEVVCALAGRLFLDTTAGGDHLEAWRQFSGQITPDDPELRQLLQGWRQLGHERRKKVLEFSQDQLALSLLRRSEEHTSE